MRFLRLFLLVGLVDGLILQVKELGSLNGRISDYDLRIGNWNRIPYAQPPVKDLRWRAPRPHGAWKESPRDAIGFGPACFSILPQAWANVSESEDCLFLNVAAPIPVRPVRSSTLLPVMVFIHGGAFALGASNYNRPDSMVAASNRSVVVVTINYRLNALGFLGGRALQPRSEDRGTGNWGIDDQRLALAWVRDHIASFGGDGQSVTIFGESAGGESVVTHLVQPASFGLYHRAIIESGCDDPFVNLNESSPTVKGAYPTAEESFQNLLNQTKCADLSCLLRMPASRLVHAVGAGKWDVWGPVVDGVTLLDRPQRLLKAGEWNRLASVLLGSNRDEFALFVVDRPGHKGWPANLTEAGFETRIKDIPNKREVSRLYSPGQGGGYPYPAERGSYSAWWWAGVRVFTDGGIPASNALGACTARRYARWMATSTQPGSGVYVYEFARPTVEAVPDLNSGALLPGTGPNGALVPHASELPFVFGRVEALHTEAERRMSAAMTAYWVGFATKGDPNRAGLPEWPEYGPGNDTVLRFGGEGISVQHHLRSTACDFWDAQADAPS